MGPDERHVGTTGAIGPTACAVRALAGLLVLAVAAVACASDDSAGRAGEPVPSVSDAAPPSCVASSGSGMLRVGAQERRYELRLPQETGSPVPLVVLFHGWASSAEQILAETELDSMGPDSGVAVVAPDGVGDPATWRLDQPDGPDATFVDQLLDELSVDPCIDAQTVWLVGHSAGAAFAAVHGCARAERLRGLVLHSGLAPPICPSDAGLDVRVVHGTADPVVPFAGGEQPVGDGSVRLDDLPTAASAWAERAGCAPVPVISTAGGADVSTWGDCAGGAEVSLTAVPGGGHEWSEVASCLVVRAASGVDPVACADG